MKSRSERRAELSKEAIKRGYTPGVTAKHLTSGKWMQISIEHFDYYDDSDSLYARGDGFTIRIYKQGTWAEIKSEPKLGPGIASIDGIGIHEKQEYIMYEGRHHRVLGNGEEVRIAGLLLRVTVSSRGYYIYSESSSNTEIFRRLDIRDCHHYVSNIVMYSAASGDFPEVRSLEDLTKVIMDLKERERIVIDRRRGPSGYPGSSRSMHERDRYEEYMMRMEHQRIHRPMREYIDMASMGGILDSLKKKEEPKKVKDYREDKDGILITKDAKEFDEDQVIVPDILPETKIIEL